MLWVTLLIFLLLPAKALHTTDLDPIHRDVGFTCDDGREHHTDHRLTAGTHGVGHSAATLLH
jgi:hypothetical protein